ncbi:MAG: transcription elongation factor GreA [Candidatus Berkelbacteria bacterium Gr01-1014_85]|uniref:Transcription elongation factor GreA n=1 Tax=Candidatus Berkelbacteria bacterium Gr01-1014_85 TaxID=2017150 RepID=A0A554J9W2_9BACT|nr:MAG: transcription elongation factor GreA [Candidatus Berkelbacteria bacterium Gr01-1014_85]
MQQNVLLTEEGLIKLKNELADLKQQRKVVISRIQAARELGDLSENADYDDARNTQSFVEGRIQEIESMLEHAKVVTKSVKADGKTAIGSQVAVTVEGE